MGKTLISEENYFQMNKIVNKQKFLNAWYWGERSNANIQGNHHLKWLLPRNFTGDYLKAYYSGWPPQGICMPLVHSFEEYRALTVPFSDRYLFPLIYIETLLQFPYHPI